MTSQPQDPLTPSMPGSISQGPSLQYMSFLENTPSPNHNGYNLEKKQMQITCTARKFESQNLRRLLVWTEDGAGTVWKHLGSSLRRHSQSCHRTCLSSAWGYTQERWKSVRVHECSQQRYLLELQPRNRSCVTWVDKQSRGITYIMECHLVIIGAVSRYRVHHEWTMRQVFRVKEGSPKDQKVYWCEWLIQVKLETELISSGDQTAWHLMG